MWMKICRILCIVLLGTISAEVKSKKNLVTEFVKKSGSSIFGGKEHIQFAILIESKESEDYDDHLDEFTKAAKNFEDKVRFVYINSDLEENWQIIEFFGLVAEDVPGVLFIDRNKGLRKYKAEINEITKAEIIKFVQTCLDGKAVPFLKSDEIPEDWNKGPVIELVGKNFEQQVFDSKKTTFVFFYAPWCAACQNAMPEVEKLGKLYKNKKSVIIARMNSINNEIPDLLILDVPTIALFIKGSTKPIYYTKDERTVNDFSQFIETNLKKIEKSGKTETDEKPEKDNDSERVETSDSIKTGKKVKKDSDSGKTEKSGSKKTGKKVKEDNESGKTKKSDNAKTGKKLKKGSEAEKTVKSSDGKTDKKPKEDSKSKTAKKKDEKKSKKKDKKEKSMSKDEL